MNPRNGLWALLVSVPLAVAGAAYASSQAGGYVCPITGERLPCPNCCPLNQGGYTCAVMGEQLTCEQCCPLNQRQ
jgi:hypothetical protein